jgi:hypothetical protein
LISSAATTNLTPTANVPLAGRGDGARLSQSIADDIEANVILLPGDPLPVAIVAVDTLFCSDALHVAIIAELSVRHGMALADLILVASHTHNAPSLDPAKPRLGQVDCTFFDTTTRRIASAIATALSCEPADPIMLERATSQCTANVVRRRRTLRIAPRRPFVEISTQMLPNRHASTPHDLTLILARDQQGDPIWALWQWTCHATAFCDPLAVSADFPGPVRQHIRNILGSPNLPVVYLPGFAGDVRADAGRSRFMLRKRMMTPFARPFPDATKENFDILCAAVCAAIDRAIAGLAPLPSFTGTAHTKRSAIAFAALMETPRHGEVGLVHVSATPLSFFFMGAETCSPYKALLAPLLPPDTLLSGYAGETPLYLPVDTQIAEGGYEVDGFRQSFDLPGNYFETIQATVCAAVAALQPTND